MPVVAGIMGYLAKKFKFSYFDEDDISQEAFILALESLDRWDRIRPLGGFIYVHIYKRLCNLKRKMYERRTLPCESCPIKAWVNKECTAFSDKMDCSLYKNWTNRNISKKSLASPDGFSDGSGANSYSRTNYRKPEILITSEEIQIDYQKAIDAMPPKVRVKFFSGKKLKEEDLEAIRENFYD